MLAVRELALRQGNFSIEKISLTVPTGRYGVLMGRTGCGKTSILEAIAGLRPVRSGSIVLGETRVDRLSAGARGIGYVPQDGALFPTMTVREHLGFALSIRRTPPGEIEHRVRELAAWLGIAPLLERYPAHLSGGEGRRVALGRALSFRPRFLLMDEPFGALDETTRTQLIELIRDIRRRTAITILHVTHSRQESQQLADVRFLLEEGRIHVETPLRNEDNVPEVE